MPSMNPEFSTENKGLGRRVWKERCRRGLTQAELSRGSDVSQATVSRLESGHVRELRPTHLVGLADCLGVSTDYLLGRVDDVNPVDVLAVDENSQRLIEKFARLDERGREQLLQFANFLLGENAG